MHESEKWKWSRSVVSDPMATPWTAAFQAPPSMGFSRQEYWSGVPLPSLRADSRSLKTVLKASLSLNYFVVSLNKAQIVKNSNERSLLWFDSLRCWQVYEKWPPLPPQKEKKWPRGVEKWGEPEAQVPAMSEEPPQTGTDQVTVRLQGHVLTSESGPDAFCSSSVSRKTTFWKLTGHSTRIILPYKSNRVWLQLIIHFHFQHNMLFIQWEDMT